MSICLQWKVIMKYSCCPVTALKYAQLKTFTAKQFDTNGWEDFRSIMSLGRSYYEINLKLQAAIMKYMHSRKRLLINNLIQIAK